MISRNLIYFVLFLFLSASLSKAGTALDPRLAPLEPLLNREWTGMLKAPDGWASYLLSERN